MTDQPTTAALEIVRLSLVNTDGLLALLHAIESEGEARLFQPHPFARDHLISLCDPRLRDLYYVLASGSDVLGYGLLRGWDEGYETPSLGIAVHPRCRASGFGSALMQFLHCAARMRGSERVRLRVSASNSTAIALYRRMGYRFEGFHEQGTPDRLIVAFKELKN